ncbi:MAG: polyisoprenoid-binding protein [Pseudonocardiales bacterium]|nr:polyisoprenoid-binding protein [Pseudonocardiales bacterium]
MTSTTTLPAELTGDYTLDPTHTRIGFVARHAMVTKVRGAFNEFEGSFHLDAANPSASTATLTVQVASVDTRNAQRDEHLRTNDFFDVPSFPTITFTSTSVEQIDEENYKVTGDLTVKGVTKSVTVDFEFGGIVTDPWGNTRVGFEGKTVLNRSDFGVSFNAALDAGGLLVSEKVTLEIEVSAVKVVAAA